MAQLGFQALRGREGQPQRWVWKGLTPPAKPKPAPRDNAFPALADLIDG